ncbi:ABC-F family ATP-binding cassette domain-containing protein [Actinomadura sp. 6N118]|uniref:ABC-F family ATP-binding cassette domain-containing protein n=1 Tax=Actinomadura sp. 6N118 TaxID=3375151 RepID=UPI0037A13379
MRTPSADSVAQLTLNEVTKRYDDRVVLDRVSFTIKPGEKVGVIGENGSGKSTLLRLMAGREAPDNGDLTVVAPGGLAYLPQSLDLVEGLAGGAATAADVIDLALADLREIEAALRAAETGLGSASDEQLAAYGDLLLEFERRGGYEADARVDIALHGLGLPGLDRARPIATLSGGQISRLALAATLAAAPELLLLDEPTNDLDDAAVAWLEDYVRTHHGTVVAITHDRVFLERITTTILEVDHETRSVRRYGDGYSGYLTAKAAARARWERAYEEWKGDVERQSRLVRTGGAWLATLGRKAPLANTGNGAHRARSSSHGTANRVRIANERLATLRENAVPPPPEPLRFTARIAGGEVAGGQIVDGQIVDGQVIDARIAGERTSGGTSDEDSIELSDVTVGGRLHVDGLRLMPGERLLIGGPNGAGKTTLLRVLAGELVPDAGSVRRPDRVGYLRQEGIAGPPRRTVLAAYAAGRPGTPDEYADELLRLGLFRPDDLRLPLGALSVGQRRRVELARLVSRPVDLLLLDEPTNHLSPMLVEELDEALAAYAGTLVVVTHDRLLRSRFTGSRLELRDGRVLETSTR